MNRSWRAWVRTSNLSVHFFVAEWGLRSESKLVRVAFPWPTGAWVRTPNLCVQLFRGRMTPGFGLQTCVCTYSVAEWGLVLNSKPVYASFLCLNNTSLPTLNLCANHLLENIVWPLLYWVQYS
jgi:hypothetical protein